MDLKRPSYLDLKMGTNCVLRSIDSKSYMNFREYDLATTSVSHGFRVTGYCLNHNNEVQEYICEDFGYSRTVAQVKNALHKLLTNPADSSHLAPSSLIKHLISRIQGIHDLCLQKGLARIVGASLFFVSSRDYFEKYTDNNEDQLIYCEVYLIDLCHMELF